MEKNHYPSNKMGLYFSDCAKREKREREYLKHHKNMVIPFINPCHAEYVMYNTSPKCVSFQPTTFPLESIFFPSE